jgi:dimethylhistidine N-methyltransferase
MTARPDPFGQSRAVESEHPVQATRASLEDVLRGLRSVPKTLSPKLFYDATGAELFERISALPEYYLTRAELGILERRRHEIAKLVGPNATLIEYGSGAGVKVRLLLDAFDSPAGYVPIDISAEQLSRVSQEIAAEYPDLQVRPLLADYVQPLSLPPLLPARRRVAFFPGSTIGNFHPAEASAFLRRIRRTVGGDGSLLLGVDRRKDVNTLHAAYNDASGVTAAFNLNVLRRLNRELGASFDLERFSHRAFFNNEASRIEMHLVSLGEQTVRIAGERISFENGETIWTESSYKYDRTRLESLVTSAGFRIVRFWSDAAEQFSVAYLGAA